MIVRASLLAVTVVFWTLPVTSVKFFSTLYSCCVLGLSTCDILFSPSISNFIHEGDWDIDTTIIYSLTTSITLSEVFPFLSQLIQQQPHRPNPLFFLLIQNLM